MDAFFAGTHVRELKPDADFLAGSLSGVVAWTHRVKGPDQHVVLADMEKVRKHIFWDAVCILKVIILPRQARDKHTKKAGFSQIRVDGESFTCPASGCPIGTNFLTGAKANYTPHRVSQVDTTDRVDRLCTPSGAGIRACAVLDINGST